MTLEKRLLEEVVIFRQSKPTGADALAEAHSTPEHYSAPPQPGRQALPADAGLHRQVEEFLHYQAELLDTKSWQAFIDLFSDHGIYWMPARREQVEWVDSPSIFAEDRLLMLTRMARITHPNAWSQIPDWETSHLVGNVVIEELSPASLRVRSHFQIHELRRDSIRLFAGTYRHTLSRGQGDFKIELQRVDLMNARAPFDYTIQAWI
jgi:3-phenylpropionate/cinnamic acid dioxygenase small subunit